MTIGKTIGRSQIAGGAEEGAPETDRDHRDDVVPAEERVGEAAEEAPAHAPSGVGLRGGGGEEGERGERKRSGHRCAPSNGPR
jgi:hypothetical protein